MSTDISVRELRNTLSAALRRVESGETLTVTVDRRPVAEVIPLRRRRPVDAHQALAIAAKYPADRGVLGDVRAVLPDTTDEL